VPQRFSPTDYSGSYAIRIWSVLPLPVSVPRSYLQGISAGCRASRVVEKVLFLGWPAPSFLPASIGLSFLSSLRRGDLRCSAASGPRSYFFSQNLRCFSIPTASAGSGYLGSSPPPCPFFVLPNCLPAPHLSSAPHLADGLPPPCETNCDWTTLCLPVLGLSIRPPSTFFPPRSPLFTCGPGMSAAIEN